jgi:phenylalanyl-tRNA synthetase beta chain
VYKKLNDTFVEKYMLGIFITGNKSTESYASKSAATSYSELKSYVVKTLARLGLDNLKTSECDESELLNEGLQLSAGKKIIAKITEVKKSTLKKQDIFQPVYYAEIEWDNLMAVVPTKASQFKELAKFPEVRRDLALLINKDVKYQQIEELAYQAERNLLKNVNLFDIYEGDKLEQGKKSYAVSFTLQDENNTLNDKQIEKIMEKLIKTYQEKLGATIR